MLQMLNFMLIGLISFWSRHRQEDLGIIYYLPHLLTRKRGITPLSRSSKILWLSHRLALLRLRLKVEATVMLIRIHWWRQEEASLTPGRSWKGACRQVCHWRRMATLWARLRPP